MPTKEKTIVVRELSKTFDELVAVDDISFEVEEGESFGLVGPNGAGKTTTLMLLATVLNPTSGSASIYGHSILNDRDEVRKSIGIVFEEMSLDIQLNARENMDFHARMYHLPKKIREERISETLEVVGLIDKADITVKDYSGGMQRRLEIARSMLTHPRVLLLDEPTVGLDVQTRRFLWDYVRELNRKRGMTVLLATHYIEEADYLCDRVGIMDKGRMVITDTPRGLKDSVGKSVISLRLSQGSSEDFARVLGRLPWVEKLRENDGLLELSLGREDINLADIAKLARENGFAISFMRLRKPSLEDVFFHYVGTPLEEANATLLGKEGNIWQPS
jgi:ABC-2 type transport system ATP-binding protein